MVTRLGTRLLAQCRQSWPTALLNCSTMASAARSLVALAAESLVVEMIPCPQAGRSCSIVLGSCRLVNKGGVWIRFWSRLCRRWRSSSGGNGGDAYGS
jgi:hypothetical protein